LGQKQAGMVSGASLPLRSRMAPFALNTQGILLVEILLNWKSPSSEWSMDGLCNGEYAMEEAQESWYTQPNSWMKTPSRGQQKVSASYTVHPQEISPVYAQ